MRMSRANVCQQRLMTSVNNLSELINVYMRLRYLLSLVYAGMQIQCTRGLWVMFGMWYRSRLGASSMLNYH